MVAMWRENEEWRVKENVPAVLNTVFAAPGKLEEVYPMGFYGKDRTGRPVRYDCFGRVDAEELWALLGGEQGREHGRTQVRTQAIPTAT